MPKRDLLTITDLSRDEIQRLITVAMRLKARHKAGERYAHLAGRTLGMIFEKSSTRTRVSFEAGMFHLGGHAIMLTSRDSQLGRGETLRDTAAVMSRYVDGLVVRTFHQDDVAEMARYATVPVLNGLTDLTHPCQVLSDLMTVYEKFQTLNRLHIAFVGDGNNMANSWVTAAHVLGFRLTVACPEGHGPDAEILAAAQAAQPGQVHVTHDPREAVDGAHVVNTDVWTSMGQEGEAEARLKRFAPFQVSRGLLAGAAHDHIVMHCLPAHRGEEIESEVLDGPASVVFEQAENRLHMQKAILIKLLAGIETVP